MTVKYNVLSYDPVADDVFDFEWRFRVRNVNAAKALKTVNELLCMGYDRDVSISVDEVDADKDVLLQGEEATGIFTPWVSEKPKAPEKLKQRTMFD